MYIGFTIDCICIRICTCTRIAHADVSFCSCFFPLFLCINICVVFFVQATSFNERNASLVAFQVL